MKCYYKSVICLGKESKDCTSLKVPWTKQNKEAACQGHPREKGAPGASGLPGTAPSMGSLVGLAVLFELKYHKRYQIVGVRRRYMKLSRHSKKSL